MKHIDTRVSCVDNCTSPSIIRRKLNKGFVLYLFSFYFWSWFVGIENEPTNSTDPRNVGVKDEKEAIEIIEEKTWEIEKKKTSMTWYSIMISIIFLLNKLNTKKLRFTPCTLSSLLKRSLYSRATNINKLNSGRSDGC